MFWCAFLGFTFLDRPRLAIYPIRRHAAHDCIATTPVQKFMAA
jgi:hypothetical protein